MPLQQDLAEFCVDLKIAPGELCLTLPGGAELCASIPSDVPDIGEAIKKLFESANSALTPLVPIFDILDAIVALNNCVQAIPDALGPPPDPQKMAQCVPELAKKIDALLRLLPQVSLPIFIAQVIDNLILFLEAYKGRLLVMINRAKSIIDAQTRAAALGNVQLSVLLDCASGNLSAELNNLNAGFTPLNRLLGVVNAFAELAGLPCIPGLTTITDLTDEALIPIDEAIELLMRLRELIPVPVFEPGESPATFKKACE